MPETTPYRVLARKYRPQRFDDLIGQDVLVRTLSNAIQSGRLAHAFLLTGIRGIGKTTTARIIARGLNCTGPDNQGGPTTQPCGVCSNCQMILDDRHVDVIEMDAASHTGVDDIRGIIDTVHYAPTMARYKIYIIDEVHMLSKNAFNALLKTLEEPPPHVIFIFATTELRKIPITIVSRCQRFDLRRLDVETLTAHLQNICSQEQVAVATEGLELIANAAEGSVRDALSLLDQAISLSENPASDAISNEQVRAMLGLADKQQNLTLLEQLFAGEAKEALVTLRQLYAQGADPLLLMQDLLELVHRITQLALASTVQQPTLSEGERARCAALAEKLAMPELTRAWQLLLKGIGEIRHAPNPLAAAEMVAVRLAYASTLPTPAEVIRTGAGAPSSSTHEPPVAAPRPSASRAANPAARGNLALAAQAQSISAPAPAISEAPVVEARSYEEAAALFEQFREPILCSYLRNDLRLVSFTVGRIEVNPVAVLPPDVLPRIARCLSEWTGERWSVATSNATGQPTLREQALQAKQQLLAYAADHPNVRALTQHFPGAEVVEIIGEKDEE